MITTDQAKLIVDARAEGRARLPARMLEKDLIIVEALRAIASLNIEGIILTFSGGTCLAKAHKLLERMSEDVDFRVTLTDSSALTRSGARACMGKLKSAVTSAMREAQFEIPDQAIRARNDNQFLAFELEYVSLYEPEQALRPSLRVEFIAIPPRLPTTICEIRPLIDELTDRTTAAPVSLACVSVEETYCEKIISYLRRSTEYISARARLQYEGRLARHVYDVHRIITLRYPDALKSPPTELFAELLVAETAQYGNRDLRFARRPVETLRRTLARVGNNDLFRDHYDEFAQALVYERHKPSFEEAFATFRRIAVVLLKSSESRIPELMMGLYDDSDEDREMIH
jgi:predicted nucleotidyltransferase component of viral defense system